MTLGEHVKAVLGLDLRAALADVFGYRILTPDQERLVDVIQTQPIVVAMGAAGCGKSFIFGACAALAIAISPGMKALFGAGKYEQAQKLSWLELQRALRAAEEHSIREFQGRRYRLNWAGAGCGISDWYPAGKEKNPDWFAVCMALSDRNNAANVKGIMHAPRSLVVLDEMEGVAPEVQEALYAGITQENAHFWLAFNPVDPENAAARFWARVPSEARVQFSALRTAEWMAREGVIIPGMPTLEAIEQHWRGRENEPAYYAYVLGEFPPASVDTVVIPRDWYDMVTECVPADADGDKPIFFGVDTAGGGAENVIASVQGRVVRLEWCNREQHQTPRVVAAVQECASRYRQRPVVVVDYVGLGGKGVADDLAASGWRVIPFIGGGQEFWGQRDPTGLYADAATWAWFTVRELVRRTVEAIRDGRPERYISLPRDPVLRVQFERKFRVAADRRYRMQEKSEMLASPDRADAVAMAVLASQCPYATAARVAAVV